MRIGMNIVNRITISRLHFIFWFLLYTVYIFYFDLLDLYVLLTPFRYRSRLWSRFVSGVWSALFLWIKIFIWERTLCIFISSGRLTHLNALEHRDLAFVAHRDVIHAVGSAYILRFAEMIILFYTTLPIAIAHTCPIQITHRSSLRQIVLINI